MPLHGALILFGTWLGGLVATAFVFYRIGMSVGRDERRPRLSLRQLMDVAGVRDHSRPGPRSRLARHPDPDQTVTLPQSDTAVQPQIERVMPR